MQENHKPIELSPEDINTQPMFSNMAGVMNSETEFYIDFLSLMPGMRHPKLLARILLTPEHAKQLSKALTDNVARFEAAQGKIKPMRNPVISGKGGHA